MFKHNFSKSLIEQYWCYKVNYDVIYYDFRMRKEFVLISFKRPEERKL